MPAPAADPSATVSGHKIALAPLATVSYARLAAPEPDAAEVRKLVTAAQSPGFFYLDLREAPDAGHYIEQVQALYGLGGRFFREPEDAKMRSFVEGEEKGYKPPEYGCETFEIRRDELLSDEPPIPLALVPQADLLKSFVRTSHAVTRTLLEHFLKAPALTELGAQGLAAIDHVNADAARSPSGLKLESAPLCARLEDVPPSEHTDGGTITLLWCGNYTTEVRMPPPSGVPAAREDVDWRFVEPRVGCAIVNVADSLQRATEGRLMSCLHRVGQPAPVPEPSEQDRVCVLYYLRPGKVPAESGANGTNGHT